MIKVEKNIPIPNTKGRKMKYPFDTMEVGDSFEVVNVKKNTIIGGAKAWSKRNKSKKDFTLRTIDGKFRLWRIR